jgi:hypothetical protein
MLTTGNHIDRFVNAYNAYTRWEQTAARALTFAGPERIFDGEHVRTSRELPATAREGQTIFVGDFARRDGAFYEYVDGQWRSTLE